tara:strand:- start:164 stop:688 length:525 start_codon:yes stop_codon:yes gene_type:complete
MSGSSPFVINFAGLKQGFHNFNFNIDKKFFEGYDYFDFEGVELITKVSFEKQERILNILFNISGNVKVCCDVSMELFKMPVKSNFNLTVKFGKIYNNENDDLLLLPYGAHQIDISKYIFEMVILSIPIKKVHPGIKDGSLKSDLLQRLKLLEPKEKKFPSKIDHRWNKLKDLLK